MRDVPPARLVLIEGPEAGLVFTVGAAPMLLGRAEDVGIKVLGRGVSRHHAKIVRGAEGEVIVSDLGSANGTFVNDRRITKATLSPGDHLRLGRDAVLELELASPDERDTVDLAGGEPAQPIERTLTSTMRNLGRLRLVEREFSLALRPLEQVKRRLDELPNPPPRELAAALVDVGECHLGRGEFSPARTVLQRALDLLTRDSATDRELAPVRFAMARAVRREDAVRARELAQACRDALPASDGLHRRSAAWLAALCTEPGSADLR